MFTDYLIKAVLGNSVFFAQHRTTSEYVAIKRYQMDSFTDDICKLIEEEIATIKQFHHSNIISFHKVFVRNYDIHCVQEFFCFGSCKETIMNYFVTGFPEIIVALILKDVLTALEYLHKRGFIHRSIRASHILLNQNRAVLSGFRESTTFLTHGERVRNLHSLPPNSAKSLNWLAPEVLEQNLLGYTEKSDIYSIGITCCELANGIAPFADLPTTLMLTEKIRGNQPSLLDFSTCPSAEVIAQAMDSGIGIGEAFAADQTRAVYCQRQLSDPFHKFAEICMTRFPDNRPNTSQLLHHHPFFKQTKHTSLEEQLKNSLQPVDLDKVTDESVAKLNDDDLCNELESLNVESIEWDF